MNQQRLRERVRLLKATQETTYKELAQDLLDIKAGSFYNFMNRRTKLSNEKATLLQDYLENFLE